MILPLAKSNQSALEQTRWVCSGQTAACSRCSQALMSFYILCYVPPQLLLVVSPTQPYYRCRLTAAWSSGGAAPRWARNKAYYTHYICSKECRFCALFSLESILNKTSDNIHCLQYLLQEMNGKEGETAEIKLSLSGLLEIESGHKT